MRLITFFCLCILAIPSKASGDFLDKILVNGEQHYFLSESIGPLDDKFSKEAILAIRDRVFGMPTALCTANRRGYVATWEIKDSRLLLREVDLNACGGPPVLVPLRTLFPDKSLPIHADWYTGSLDLTKGEARYTGPGREMRTQGYLRMAIEKGQVMSRERGERPAL